MGPLKCPYIRSSNPVGPFYLVFIAMTHLLLENYPLIGAAAGSLMVGIGIGRSASVKKTIVPLSVHNGLIRLNIIKIEFNFVEAQELHDIVPDYELYQIMNKEFVEVPQEIVMAAIVDRDINDLLEFIQESILNTFFEITSLAYKVV
jgi:hypothetical protein